jgi:glyoxylase-like metal-dependent hydrolase (beta-lactamase superfamily II)
MPVEMITERAGYIPGAVNVGVILGEAGSVAMVDTGLNETNARKALKAIATELDRPVTLVLTTHAHADHFGGNATVVKRTGAQVWAPPIDEAIIRNPILQPSLLFAGADPPPSLRGGFLLADASPVDRVVDEPSVTVEGVPIEVVPLQGHSPGQIGLVADGVFFCADVALPEPVLEKYRIPYLYSVGFHLESLERAKAVECQMAVPGHGPTVDRLDALIERNQRLVHDVIAFLLEAAKEPRTAESLFLATLDRFDAPIADAAGYYLLHPTIHAFLAYLVREGRMTAEVVDRRMVWRTTR